MNLYNISYLCNYFSSSVSEWEKYKNGKLLDGSLSKNRYSVHTLDELHPFVHIDLDTPCFIRDIEVIIRDIYLDRVIPLNLQIKTLNGWKDICEVNKATRVSINETVISVRISKSSQGCVVLSSVNIYTDYASFLSWYDTRCYNNLDSLAYIHCKFYGLGGRLSVIATALGFIGDQNYTKEVILDTDTANVIKFPRVINLNKNERHYKILEQGLASHFKDYIFDNGQYISKRGIASYTAEEQLAGQLRKAVVITRDNLKFYANKDESNIEACRRLYSRIIPHDKVLERLKSLEEKHNLKINYNKAIGIHIRHGNGEKYYSPTQNVWGVKPPTAKEIFKTLTNIFEKDSSITDLVLSSDCQAVASFIKQSFPKKRVHYISEYVQPIGFGCNHNNITFDSTLKINTFSRELEDEIVFSEILALSRCKGICGGHSYFFEAVKYFSQCEIDNIYYLNNSDRYIKIHEGFHLLADSIEDDLVSIREQLKNNGIYIDGLFYSKSKINHVSISYFDNIIFEGKIISKLSMSDITSMKEKLFNLRLY